MNPSIVVAPMINYDPLVRQIQRLLLINFQTKIVQCKSKDEKIIYKSLYCSYFRYSAIVVKYFWVIILFTVAVSISCIAIALIVKGVPDWSDPYQVFIISNQESIPVGCVAYRPSVAVASLPTGIPYPPQICYPRIP